MDEANTVVNDSLLQLRDEVSQWKAATTETVNDLTNQVAELKNELSIYQLTHSEVHNNLNQTVFSLDSEVQTLKTEAEQVPKESVGGVEEIPVKAIQAAETPAQTERKVFRLFQ